MIYIYLYKEFRSQRKSNFFAWEARPIQHCWECFGEFSCNSYFQSSFRMKHIFDEKRNENKIDEFSYKSHFKSFAMSRQIKENYLGKNSWSVVFWVETSIRNRFTHWMKHWLQLFHWNSDLMVSFAHLILFIWIPFFLIGATFPLELRFHDFFCTFDDFLSFPVELVLLIYLWIISYLLGTEGRMVSQFTLMMRAQTLIHRQGDELC